MQAQMSHRLGGMVRDESTGEIRHAEALDEKGEGVGDQGRGKCRCKDKLWGSPEVNGIGALNKTPSASSQDLSRWYSYPEGLNVAKAARHRGCEAHRQSYVDGV